MTEKRYLPAFSLRFFHGKYKNGPALSLPDPAALCAIPCPAPRSVVITEGRRAIHAFVLIFSSLRLTSLAVSSIFGKEAASHTNHHAASFAAARSEIRECIMKEEDADRKGNSLKPRFKIFTGGSIASSACDMQGDKDEKFFKSFTPPDLSARQGAQMGAKYERSALSYY